MENNKTEAKTYTEKEVIGFTIGILEGISYPAFLMEMPIQQMIVIKQNIIDPIAAAKGNLRTLLGEMEKAEKANAEKPAEEFEGGEPEDEEIIDSPVLEVVKE